MAGVNRVISPSAASTLLEFVNQELTKQREQVMDGSTAESMRFGDVLSRENRFDLKLDLDPPVREALNEAIESIKPVFAGTLGEDAELFELAALISDPRSPRQPVHPDTPFRQGEGAAAITAFVALQVSTRIPAGRDTLSNTLLNIHRVHPRSHPGPRPQDVDEEMGPTSVIPGTITAEAHERFNNRDDGGRERVALLREKPNHVGVLQTGDANLIDSRVIHCGGANASTKRRVLFYFSFKAKGARVPAGSLLTSLRREGYTLDGVDQWAAPLTTA